MLIAIIGGGATGVLAALHLNLAFRQRAAEILVIDPAKVIGRGVAYATDDPRHLLNVRLSDMSAFADQPDHFLRWLERHGPGRGIVNPKPFCFVPRWVYGAYITDIAHSLLSTGAVGQVRDQCVDFAECGDSIEVKLASGNEIVADWLVLATGVEAKRSLSGIPVVQPWAHDALREVAGDEPVLILGTGLSMIDAVLSLDRLGHRGRITALSPHGLLPMPHRSAERFAIAAEDVPFATDISDLAIWLRRLCRGRDWRAAIDALRPHTQRLWRSMSPTQRRRFLRHALPYWNVHRHRVAPEAEKQIVALRASGRLEIMAGRPRRLERAGRWIIAEIAKRGGGGIDKRRFARLIDCTGVESDLFRSSNRLIRALLASGAARPDPLGIGLDVDEGCALIDTRARHSSRVRAIGPVARAAFWECTAIPDIRLQCRQVAEKIAKSASATAGQKRQRVLLEPY